MCLFHLIVVEVINFKAVAKPHYYLFAGVDCFLFTNSSLKAIHHRAFTRITAIIITLAVKQSVDFARRKELEGDREALQLLSVSVIREVFVKDFQVFDSFATPGAAD